MASLTVAYVLCLLAASGAGFDCASNGEISPVLNTGRIDPSRIIFANPCKANSFQYGASMLRLLMIWDELYEVARTHPRAKLVFRILNGRHEKFVSIGPGIWRSACYGFHVGSGCYDPLVHSGAIIRARFAFDIAKDAGFSFNLLDVGGVLKIHHSNKAASVVKDFIGKTFPRSKKHPSDSRTWEVIGVQGLECLAAIIIARRAPFSDPEPSVVLCGGFGLVIGWVLTTWVLILFVCEQGSLSSGWWCCCRRGFSNACHSEHFGAEDAINTGWAYFHGPFRLVTLE
ncbi:hypothetical protein GGU11DRAFT_759388 [Lentinula aff. detonsa]|nr:hypothetical protein GGU11DRAFT_759388 [Lentinula aff. detonsa]